MVTTNIEHPHYVQVTNNKNYRRIPPDGGWGYVVLIGMAICFICTLGSLPCFAFVFGEFLSKLGAETSALTLITGLFFLSYSCVGPFTKYLFDRYSIRSVGLFGAILFSLGSIMTIFANSVVHLLLSFGILQGAGYGFMISVSYSTFNSYFVKNKVMMMSCSQALLCIGSMGYPMLAQFLLNKFGHRGCVAIIAAINLHCVLAMLVMHPVKWHMKVVPAETNEQEKKLLENSQYHQVNIVGFEGNKIVEISGTSLWMKIVDFLDLTLLKDPVFVNITLGMSFALYSDVSFFTIQPTYLVQLNFSQTHIAQIIAIGAMADLVSGILLVVCNECIKVRARFIYLTGATFTIAARFAFLHVNEFIGMAIMTAILGFLRTFLNVPSSVVIGEYLSKERFPSGYGLFMFMQGIVMFIFGPLAGFVRDVTQSYEIAFYCLIFAMTLCAIPWLLEIGLLKIKTFKK